MLEKIIEELKNNIPNFELRPEQNEMMQEVLNSMESKNKIVVHAPTGTGKSFGYLIPFLVKKLEDPSFKITVSTFTINLQNQIIKDLKLIKQIYSSLRPLEKPLKYTILLGKKNYFCEKRFESNRQELPNSITDKVADKIQNLKINDLRTDQQSLGINLKHNQWEMMNVDSCSKLDCPFSKNCSFYKDYFKEKSDILISNHALFFNREMFVENAWTDYNYHVFDESHKLEKVILDVFTFSLTIKKMENIIWSAFNFGSKNKLDKELLNEFASSFLEENNTYKKLTFGFDLLNKKLVNQTSTIQELNLNPANIESMVNEISSWQTQVIEHFKSTFDIENSKDNKPLLDDYNSWLNYFNDLANFKSIMSLKENQKLFWFERSKFNDLSINITPTGIEHIRDLFSGGVLFTSGTLTNNGTTKDFTDRLNVSVDKELILPTPFDLSKQTKVYISKNANPRNTSTFENQVTEETWELLKSGDLKTFVLFTSNKLMESVYNALKPRLDMLSLDLEIDIDVWLQNKSNHKNVIESFKNTNKKSVLFGTLSYFEGVSLEREALTQVILTRLPYSNPTHPVQQILDKKEEYSKWEANIRFEQAFGRLIRTKDDFGTFAILDNRINQKYNEGFLNLFTQNNIPITNNIVDIKEFHQLKKQ